MTDSGPTDTFDPDTAACVRCGYALRDLPENRCPECGTAFDPADPTTYAGGGHESRAYRLVRPDRPMSQRLLYVGVALLLWGEAWLPGGVFVSLLGVGVIVAGFGWRAVVVESGRRVAARLYRQSCELGGRWRCDRITHWPVG